MEQLTLKQKQDKAKRDQKISIAFLAALATIGVLYAFSENIVWLTIIAVYDMIVVSVILYELVDEAWVAARFKEMMDSISNEQEQEPVTIDVIS